MLFTLMVNGVKVEKSTWSILLRRGEVRKHLKEAQSSNSPFYRRKTNRARRNKAKKCTELHCTVLYCIVLCCLCMLLHYIVLYCETTFFLSLTVCHLYRCHIYPPKIVWGRAYFNPTEYLQILVLTI